jgi:hypothetical protein
VLSRCDGRSRSSIAGDRCPDGPVISPTLSRALRRVRQTAIRFTSVPTATCAGYCATDVTRTPWHARVCLYPRSRPPVGSVKRRAPWFFFVRGPCGCPRSRRRSRVRAARARVARVRGKCTYRAARRRLPVSVKVPRSHISQKCDDLQTPVIEASIEGDHVSCSHCSETARECEKNARTGQRGVDCR